MNAKASSSKKLMEAVGERMCSFLEGEFEVAINSIKFEFREIARLELNYLTSIISVEGPLKVLFAFSFESAFISHIVAVYTEGMDISDRPIHEYEEETAADIINVVLGNSLSAFSISGKVIDLSPPFVIAEAKTIYRHSNAVFLTTHIDTPYGSVDLHCIGPKGLFDNELNYIEEKL